MSGASEEVSWECDVFVFQAEDGIRYLVRSRGLGDVYKRQGKRSAVVLPLVDQQVIVGRNEVVMGAQPVVLLPVCLLYTSDAADERSSVDLGGRRILKKKKERKKQKKKTNK